MFNNVFRYYYTKTMTSCCLTLHQSKSTQYNQTLNWSKSNQQVIIPTSQIIHLMSWSLMYFSQLVKHNYRGLLRHNFLLLPQSNEFFLACATTIVWIAYNYTLYIQGMYHWSIRLLKILDATSMCCFHS